MIAIKEFPAEFSCRDSTGKENWYPCVVVGLTEDENEPQFVVIAENETLYALTVPEVRRVDG